MDWTRIGAPIDVRELFASERDQLLELLTELSPAEWAAPTICPGWDVHDVVAHVVHDYLRRLSGGRDGYGAFEPVPDAALPALINQANEEFVAAARGLSPRVLIGLMESFGPQLDAHWAASDLAAVGAFSVSWAVPDVPAPVWLDIAREYTEFWVHQQQIRDAVGQPGAADPELVGPVIDTFLRALPWALASVEVAEGVAVIVEVTEPVCRAWTATRQDAGWTLAVPTGAAAGAGAVAAGVRIGPDQLWRLATRGIRHASRIRAGLDRAVTLEDAGRGTPPE